MTTADAIFDSVIGLMFAGASDKEDYRDGFIRILNMVLEECFEVNNALRRKRGREELEEPPVIAAAEDPVPYEFELTRSVIPYGVAGTLYVDDDETGISNVYRERYAEGLAETGYMYPDAVKEVWYHGG